MSKRLFNLLPRSVQVAARAADILEVAGYGRYEKDWRVLGEDGEPCRVVEFSYLVELANEDASASDIARAVIRGEA